jgi:hypothetical protein
MVNLYASVFGLFSNTLYSQAGFVTSQPAVGSLLLEIGEELENSERN